ncbi:hypothetical protein Tco_1034490, partial [Tanacetum coccineum]
MGPGSICQKPKTDCKLRAEQYKYGSTIESKLGQDRQTCKFEVDRSKQRSTRARRLPLASIAEQSGFRTGQIEQK